MTVHLINQRSKLLNAVPLMTDGDTVIVTSDEAAVEAITAVADRLVTVTLLEGTSYRSDSFRVPETVKVLSEDEWVRYTTSAESVISWG